MYAACDAARRCLRFLCLQQSQMPKPTTAARATTPPMAMPTMAPMATPTESELLVVELLPEDIRVCCGAANALVAAVALPMGPVMEKAVVTPPATFPETEVETATAVWKAPHPNPLYPPGKLYVWQLGAVDSTQRKEKASAVRMAAMAAVESRQVVGSVQEERPKPIQHPKAE